MSLARRISENRPTYILTLLVVLSLISIASGAQANFLGRGARTAVSLLVHPFIIGFDQVGEGVTNITEMVTDYNQAKAQVDQLRLELATMQQRVVARDEAAQENKRLRTMLDFKRRHPRLQMMPAEVMGFDKKSGLLQIDRGANHGVRESMCVMTPDGVVGIITVVEPFVSYVATLHHQNCHIGVQIKRNRVTGVIHGSGGAFSHICELQYIQESDDVKVGDQVITSEGSVFPSGFPVGRVTGIQGGNSLLHTAYIEPAVNLYALDEVFIIKSAQVPLDELTSSSSKEKDSALSRVYEMPDTRTLQERLAP